LSWHIFQPNIQTSYQVLADFYYSSLGYIMLSLIFKTKLDLELNFRYLDNNNKYNSFLKPKLYKGKTTYYP
jgi:hypothetical protein